MPPKKGKKKKVVMSLADFNPEASVGMPQELKALPSAPKQAEEWEAVGGRPEYNSRGFKERTVTHDYDENALLESDEAFMQRDWTRGANFRPDEDGGDGAGAGGVERSWDGMRRSGPLDGPDGDGAERDFGAARGGVGPVDSSFDAAGPERDFGAARGGAGPVDASFDAAGGADRDFGAARGSAAFDAEFENKAGDVDFGGARRGSAAFDAEFAGGGREVDFAKRTGPMEAEFPHDKDVDFGAARGSAAFDAEFANVAKEVDFGRRAGPVEAQFGGAGKEVDFGTARGSAAFDAEFAGRTGGGGVERDMGSMRSSAVPLEGAAPQEAAGLDFGGARKMPLRGEGGGGGGGGVAPGSADVDWGARKGPLDAAPPPRAQDARDFVAAREKNPAPAPPARSEAAPVTSGRQERSAVAGSGVGGVNGEAPKERDWGRARRTQPLNPRGHRGGGGGGGGGGGDAGVANGMARLSVGDGVPSPAAKRGTGAATSPVVGKASDAGNVADGDWTTVRTAPRPTRGRGGFHNSSRGGGGGRPARLVPATGTSFSAGAAAPPVASAPVGAADPTVAGE
jgi:hypothetical protein